MTQLAVDGKVRYGIARMTDEPQALATQADLQQLRAEMHERFTTADDQLLRVFKYIDRKSEEIMRHFDVVAEQLRHDVMGANRDDVEGVKTRVTRLEQHTGLVAS